MSNKPVNQHYLPQFLLRGFAEETGKRDSPVWVFESDSHPYQTDPRDIGAAHFFYADPDESSIEVDLGKREAILGSVVAEIRKHGEIPDGASKLLAELVGQLAVRSKNIRDSFANMGETTLREAMDFVWRREDSRPRLRKALASTLEAKHGIRASPDELDGIIETCMPELKMSFARFGGMPKLLESVDPLGSTKKAQVGVLERDPENIGGRFFELRWRLLAAEEGSLVLGDVGPIALPRRKRGGKHGLLFSAQHDLIILPVADAVAVVGGVGDFSVEEISVDRLNASSAKLSSEFFVARENRPREQQLHGILGKDFRIWLESARKGARRAAAEARKKGRRRKGPGRRRSEQS